MGGQGENPEWRELVLDQTLLWASRLGGVICAVVVFATARSQPRRLIEPGFLLMFAAFACVLLLRSRPALSFRVRATSFCWLLWLLGASAMYDVGMLPGPLLCNTFAVVCAGLFLGRRALWLLLGVSGVDVVVLGNWNAVGYVVAAHAPIPLIGLRLGTGYAAMTAGVAILVRHVVAQIEHSLSATSEALRRLGIAEQARSRTERALAETELALQRSQKLEAVGRLAAGVGHDFNNSLQVVLSWASMLQGENDPLQLEEGLNAIQKAALHGSELTQRLLTFGRRDVRAPRSVSVRDLVEDGARSLRRVLPEDISVEVETSAAGAHVLVDSAQIAHVLLNLGLNARDAMPQGGRLSIHSSPVARAALPPEITWPEGPASWVLLSVSDTGTGMSADTLSHLFEPFFTTKGDRGNGLGLATSYALVQRNGGFIRARSELGRGTSFDIYFPEQAPGGQLPVTRGSTPRAQRGLCVMVAEDDDNVRSSTVRALGTAGFRVFESSDAAGAIQLLERVGSEVDVLCTDGIMPGGGTRELIERYLSRRPQGKVILCSGYVKEELLRRQIDAGALAYLAKPFLPAELVERIHTLLGLTPVGQRPVSLPPVGSAYGVPPLDD
jgi:signal transduction histidine kinase/CheY-like chemotaxis protein